VTEDIRVVVALGEHSYNECMEGNAAMKQSFSTRGPPLLVFTDLDGTLLDEDSYSFAAATPALVRLRELRIPLIAATSKTLAEAAGINAAMGNPYPCIVENGSAVCAPVRYFPDPLASGDSRGYEVVRFGPNYGWLTSELARLRDEQGYRFTGFADMSDATVARLTNLTSSAAHNARQRLASEPLLWQDSREALHRFGEDLHRRGLRLVRGGRFWHVLGMADKGTAMDWLVGVYRRNGLARPITVALGDSPNDLDMLRAADVPVVVRRKDGSHLALPGKHGARLSVQAGPEGWSSSVLQILQDFGEHHVDA
jgi:mannosyl-3-phosphoglycerate phosphatase